MSGIAAFAASSLPLPASATPSSGIAAQGREGPAACRGTRPVPVDETPQGRATLPGDAPDCNGNNRVPGRVCTVAKYREVGCWRVSGAGLFGSSEKRSAMACQPCTSQFCHSSCVWWALAHPVHLWARGGRVGGRSAVDSKCGPLPLHPNAALHSSHTPSFCLDHPADYQLLPSDCSSMVGSPEAGLPPATPATPAAPASAGSSQVGSLCDNLPAYVYDPPIETVVFAWGVNEDGQLGLESAGAGGGNVLAPKVVEACLGERPLDPAGATAAYPPTCMHAAFLKLPGVPACFGWPRAELACRQLLGCPESLLAPVCLQAPASGAASLDARPWWPAAATPWALMATATSSPG